jgi:hypothetical protein
MHRRAIGRVVSGLGFAGAALLALATSAFATSWIRFDLRRASRDCPKICAGRILTLEPQKIPTRVFGPDGICTRVTMKVSQGIKGVDASTETFSFWLLGGAIGSDVQEVAGGPVVEPGKDYLLFFVESEGKYWPLFGGALPIVRNVVIGRTGDTVERNERLDRILTQIDGFLLEQKRASEGGGHGR